MLASCVFSVDEDYFVVIAIYGTNEEIWVLLTIFIFLVRIYLAF